MKAIETRYVGPTNFRGSRCIADDGDGNRVTLSWGSAKNSEDMHRAAAQALCDKMKWTGKMASGSTKRGMVFVFVR